MLRLFVTAMVSALIPLATADAPYPVYQTTVTVPASASASLIDALQTGPEQYLSSVASLAAYSSLAHLLETDSSLPAAAVSAVASADNDPFLLALDYLTATETPVWITQVPTAVEQFVTSVDNVLASDRATLIAEFGQKSGAVSTCPDWYVLVAGLVLGIPLVGIYFM